MWRFNEAGSTLGTRWTQSSHADGGDRESGTAIIGDDPGFPLPIATTVDAPSSNSPYLIT